jgi:hypothetical protein
MSFDTKKEQIKSVLYYINAHRDGCCGSYVQDHFKMTQEDLISLFKQMYHEELIDFANLSENQPLDDDFLNAMVLISGGYTHPDYKDIY